MLPSDRQPRRAVRRPVLYRGLHHRHLLQAVVPSADTQTRECFLPYDGRVRPASRLQGVSQMPARRDSRLAALESRFDTGRACDAADCRRSGRSVRRNGSRAPTRIQHPPSDQSADQRARCRSVGTCESPPRRHCTNAHPVDGPSPVGCGIRRRLHIRPAVQLDYPSCVLAESIGASHPHERSADSRRNQPSASRTHSVRGRGDARVPSSPRCSRARALRRNTVHAHPETPSRHWHRDRRLLDGRCRLHPNKVGARPGPGCSDRRLAPAPSARSRLRSRRHRPRARRRPESGTSGGIEPRHTDTRMCRCPRVVDSVPDRSASIGERSQGTHCETG